jgi:hypothetical protein
MCDASATLAMPLLLERIVASVVVAHEHAGGPEHVDGYVTAPREIESVAGEARATKAQMNAFDACRVIFQAGLVGVDQEVLTDHFEEWRSQWLELLSRQMRATVLALACVSTSSTSRLGSRSRESRPPSNARVPWRIVRFVTDNDGTAPVEQRRDTAERTSAACNMRGTRESQVLQLTVVSTVALAHRLDAARVHREPTSARTTITVVWAPQFAWRSASVVGES